MRKNAVVEGVLIGLTIITLAIAGVRGCTAEPTLTVPKGYTILRSKSTMRYTYKSPSGVICSGTWGTERAAIQGARFAAGPDETEWERVRTRK